MALNKNDYFLDVSGYQPADLRGITAAAGTENTIIKVSESTGYYNSSAQMQVNTSNCIGFYHFARFGGDSNTAIAEANTFVSWLPKRDVKYLVCDYEDSASGDKQANTNAVLAFMDVCKANGYQPIYYSYRPFTLANIYHDQINARYPDSTWIAAYPNYAVTPDPVWSIFPSIDGARWWQFTSTGIAGGLDKNVVLLPDGHDGTTQEEAILSLSMKGNVMYTIGAKDRGIGVVDGGSFFGLQHENDPIQYWNAGAKHINVSTKSFDIIQANAVNAKQTETNELLKKLVAK